MSLFGELNGPYRQVVELIPSLPADAGARGQHQGRAKPLTLRFKRVCRWLQLSADPTCFFHGN